MIYSVILDKKYKIAVFFLLKTSKYIGLKFCSVHKNLNCFFGKKNQSFIWLFKATKINVVWLYNNEKSRQMNKI